MNSNDGMVKYLWPWIQKGAAVLASFVGAAIVALYYHQDKILYIPNPPGFPKTVTENPPYFQNPGEWTVKGHPKRTSSTSAGIPYEDVIVETDDGEKIHCWLLTQPNVTAIVPTLVYFHGNAGNMGFRLKNAAEMYARVGINILMVDYRGYGSSTGIPNEVGLNKDGDAVLSFLINEKQLKGPIILFGRSLGGAVAVSLADRHPEQVQGLILENTFLSISHMVDKLMPFISAVKSLLLRINWDSDKKIKNLKQPILFISGDSDELVPPAHMKTLYDLATSSSYREFYSVSGGRHNDTWETAKETYYEKLFYFFNKIKENETKLKPDQSFPKNVEDDNDESLSAKECAIPTMTSKFTVK